MDSYPPLARTPLVYLRQMLSESVPLRIGLMAVFTALGTFFESSTPVAFERVINGLTGVRDAEHLGAVHWFIGLIGLSAGAMVFFRLYQWVDVRASADLRAHIQKRQIAYLLNRSPASLQHRHGGALVESIKRSSYNCVALVQLLTFDVVNMMVVILNISIILYIADSHYALMIIGWLVIYLSGTTFFAFRCLRLGRQQFMASGQSAGQISDVLRNFETVYSYGASQRENRFLAEGLDEERRRTCQLRSYVLLMRVFSSVAVFSLFAVMTTLALQDVLAGERNVGAFALVFTATNILVMTVFDLSKNLIGFYENLGSLDGALDFILQDDLTPAPSPAVQGSAHNVAKQTGRIEFKNVCFGYPGEGLLFNDLNLTVESGHKIGLVGPSGAGKTTLIRLIQGQLTPSSGQILLDGVELKTFDRDALSEKFAVVSQHVGIFNRTVRDNIAYGAPDADDASVLRAAQMASAETFIKRRVAGFNTVAGENGSEFSGGERQRLSLARALLKPGCPTLILDEATSALDTAAEQDIQRAIANAMSDRMVIAIAHRVSTIKDMDLIIYLEAGRILEQGTHLQLVAKQGRYGKIWDKQGRYSMRIEA
ncbi:ABC transporter ATP-binding protein [Pseudomonas sp. CFBP 13711]|uniref:ABC transporter ATP-binding protein n=1 Tax=unclassified Pseudomonas TaxID=196821 RepID=UPI0017860382|nr:MULTISPECIES: ABC transporter ATP-binding protein [unclassified Pseudomonas]MBD8708483.1 ABC transporter ATP-binding protein [Pseudomonas sp. CFBP 13711]MBD8713925.1 ABC transporter ATP-binding protein [Pseudomonas sp. CFBP 13715]